MTIFKHHRFPVFPHVRILQIFQIEPAPGNAGIAQMGKGNATEPSRFFAQKGFDGVQMSAIPSTNSDFKCPLLSNLGLE